LKFEFVRKILNGACIAALKTNRLYITYDVSEEYVRPAEKKAREYLSLNLGLRLLLLGENEP